MGSWSYAYFAVKDVLSDRLSFSEAVAGRGSRLTHFELTSAMLVQDSLAERMRLILS